MPGSARELLLRRLLMEAHGQDRRKVVPARALPPALIAEKYAADLRRQVGHLESMLLRSLDELTPPVEVRTDARTYRASTVIGQILDQIAVVYRREVKRTASDAATATSDHGRRVLDAQWQEVLGVDYPEEGDPVRTRIEAFRDSNVDLITKMTGEELDTIKVELRRMGPTARIEDIRKMLTKRMGVTRSRATLIARDQVLKLNSQLTQVRHEEAGVEEYDWSSSQDERVRETKYQNHVRLNGTRHRWDSPPVVNTKNGDRAHPGEYFQCRCTPRPVFDLKAMGAAAIRSPHQRVFSRRV